MYLVTGGTGYKNGEGIGNGSPLATTEILVHGTRRWKVLESAEHPFGKLAFGHVSFDNKIFITGELSLHPFLKSY